MRFGLTEEQEALRKMVRSFAATEVLPHVSEWDEKSEFPHEVVKKMGAMGLMGVIFPEELGGAGMGYVEYVMAIEELSRVDGSVGIIVASHNSLCTNHIMLAGNDEQRQALDSEARERAVAGRVGIDRTGLRLRCRRHAHHGSPQGRSLGPERIQNLSSPTEPMRIARWSWPSPIRRKRRVVASRGSWSRRELRAFGRARRRTSWGCARAIRRS